MGNNALVTSFGNKKFFLSSSGVRSVWVRHNLGNFKERLKALEEKVASEGIMLTEAQVVALEKKKFDDQSCGEIETAHLLRWNA